VSSVIFGALNDAVSRINASRADDSDAIDGRVEFCTATGQSSIRLPEERRSQEVCLIWLQKKIVELCVAMAACR